MRQERTSSGDAPSVLDSALKTMTTSAIIMIGLVVSIGLIPGHLTA